MSDVIEIKNLCKNYADFSLSNISFSLPMGSIMGLVGQNGAGKTTIIRLILNMANRDDGEVRIFGLDNLNDEQKIKQDIAAVFDEIFFVDIWKVREVEKAINGFYSKWDSKLYSQYLKKFRLPADKKVKDLSRGMKMKLMLAVALSHEAKLLILDEPTSGLDPVARDELLEILKDYIADGRKSILFSTHITSDLERIADYITLIDNGNMIYTGTKDDLLKRFSGLLPRLSMRFWYLSVKEAGAMGNIQNVVRLEFYTVKSIYRMAVLTYLISILFGIIAQPVIPIFLIMVFGVFFSGTVFSIYEKNHLDKLYGILPLGKSEIVIGRYLYAFLFGIVQAIFAGIISYVISRVTEMVSDNFVLTTTLALSFIYFCFAVGTEFPIYFRFGFSKAYVFTMVPIYLIFIGAVFLSRKTNALDNLKDILLYFSGHQVMLLLSGIGIGLILLVISGAISYSVYKKSEL